MGHAVACTCDLGRHWGRHGAAGVLLEADDGMVLLARRSALVDAPGWSIPGGAIEPGETPLAAAMREAREELGVDVQAHVIGSPSVYADTCAGGWTYWTVEARAARRFEPAPRSWETSDAQWLRPADVTVLLGRHELHEGFARYWQTRAR